MSKHILTPPLTAARQTTQMVGQEKALQKIKEAVSPSAQGFKVVLIRAQGGMGKTRLLEEVLCRAGHPDWRTNCADKWSPLGKVAISDLVDLINIRLHVRDRFIRALRDSLSHAAGVDFFHFDQQFDKLQRLRASGAEFQRIRDEAGKTTDVFLEDLAANTKTQRVVLVLDTVEQLKFVTSEWLLSQDLLTPEDMKGRTHQWLVELIKLKELQNITLILAGRGEEGESFFSLIEETINETQNQDVPRELVKIDLERFNQEETREYFAYLAQDWVRYTDKSRDTSSNQYVAQQFAAIADKASERYKVLWLYTGGIPVRLALYAQLIVENRTIPDPLRWSFAKSCAQAKTDDPQHGTPELRQLQWQIEDEFINLVFGHPSDLRARILQMLVRAPRGLSAAQLHYLLDNKGQLPEEWIPDPSRLQELASLLKSMENYYLVKRRSPWLDFAELLPDLERGSATYRLGLQDEIYRIYAEHMAPSAEPQKLEVKEIFDVLPETEQERYQQNREDEKVERTELFEKLRDWAAYQHDKYLQQKRDYMVADEKELELQIVPDDPRTFRFKELSDTEVERRLAIQAAIDTFNVEAMVYALALDPERNLNRDYIDMGITIAKTEVEEFDIWTQSELWRIIYDDYSLKFIDFRLREMAKARGESTLVVLRRAAQQEDVTRWIKRLTTRGDFRRAIEFAQQVEDAIQAMPRESHSEMGVWRSWNHSLVKNERQIWTCYAQNFLARNIPGIIATLKDSIEVLLKLYAHPVSKTAVVREDGFGEKGFRESIDPPIPAHPAEDRLRRLLSYAYNTIGYSYISLGRVREAVSSYGQSLYYVRGDQGVNAHRAVVLNNLSRALSDLGRQSVAVCRDGLNLRRQLAQEAPLAYSFNTLALIHDDLGRYEDAQVLAAKAIAYFRRIDNARGLGLSLWQLGESLRHLALRPQAGETAVATPESLYSTADNLLREAYTIFTNSEEKVRLAEVTIELGSLYRDRLRPNGEGALPRLWSGYYREAVALLDKAIELTMDRGLQRLEVDARVNKAWIAFHVREQPQALQMLLESEEQGNEEVRYPQVLLNYLDKIEDKITEKYLITPNYHPNPQDGALKDIHWVLPQLSKTQMLRGRIAFAEFSKRVIFFKQQYPDNLNKRHQAAHEDENAQQALTAAAKAYALALGYAELFAPGSRLIQSVVDDLYQQLKSFNPYELDDFHDSAFIIEKAYPTLRGAAVLGPFLHEFFGIPTSDHDHAGGSMHGVKDAS